MSIPFNPLIRHDNLGLETQAIDLNPVTLLRNLYTKQDPGSNHGLPLGTDRLTIRPNIYSYMLLDEFTLSAGLCPERNPVFPL